MSGDDSKELEQQIRSLCGQEDFGGAATAAIRGYGAQIFGLLVALHRNEQDAAEVFSIFTEALWLGMPRFSWECSFRTWAYTLARHASYRYKKRGGRHLRRELPLSAHSALSVMEQQVRTETLPYLRTQLKNRLLELRDSLSDHDKLLLILRVDKRLSWDDLARVMRGGKQPVAPDVLKRESARLRKRFQLVKETLFDLGRRRGLFDPP